MSDVNEYVVRAVRGDEWAAVKELRLLALRDPVAHLAYLDTYEAAVARPDSFWQERAEGADTVRQFVAETGTGRWIGTLTVLVEEAGVPDWAGHVVERRQGHVVGVYVRPEGRGAGVIRALLAAGQEWAWGLEPEVERVRLIVHEENLRAQAAYRKAGYRPTGVTVKLEGHEGAYEQEFVIPRPR
ncbi:MULTISPECIES: GNAT family N-acetyltransferase [unclassified Streptomyces]|uniref:GNAT family N-acetyltransferase n=1 Tax=unclassified Streptomyces TaxID=2593676 RepID=UPI0037FA79A9